MSSLESSRGVDVSSPVALALRALQKLDAATPVTAYALVPQMRPLLLEACTALGRELGLECTGEDEGGGGHYDHCGDTCPVHEWLVYEDAEEDV